MMSYSGLRWSAVSPVSRGYSRPPAAARYPTGRREQLGRADGDHGGGATLLNLGRGRADNLEQLCVERPLAARGSARGQILFKTTHPLIERDDLALKLVLKVCFGGASPHESQAEELHAGA